MVSVANQVAEGEAWENRRNIPMAKLVCQSDSLLYPAPKHMHRPSDTCQESYAVLGSGRSKEGTERGLY